VDVYLTAVRKACYVLSRESDADQIRWAYRSLARAAPSHYLLPILAQRAPDLSTHLAAFKHRVGNATFGAMAVLLAVAFVEVLALFCAALQLWFDHLDAEAVQISGGERVP
jgi:hypothetical protein